MKYDIQNLKLVIRDKKKLVALELGVSNHSTSLFEGICGRLDIILEKEMATHSSVLAWRIPGTGKPGWLPSMGSHRVRHD